MKDSKENALEELYAAAHKLGWQIAVPDGDIVSGLIIGTEEFINSMAGDDFEIWEFHGNNGPIDPESLN